MCVWKKKSQCFVVSGISEVCSIPNKTAQFPISRSLTVPNCRVTLEIKVKVPIRSCLWVCVCVYVCVCFLVCVYIWYQESLILFSYPYYIQELISNRSLALYCRHPSKIFYNYDKFNSFSDNFVYTNSAIAGSV